MKKPRKLPHIEVKTFGLRELSPAEYNPRTISDEAFAGLEKSISHFGLVDPPVVNVRKGKKIIVGGHQRYKVLLKMHGPDGLVSCSVVHLSEADEKLLNVALNNPHTQGEFSGQLAGYIEGLKAMLPEQDFIDLRLKELQGEIEDGKPTKGEDKPEVEFTRELLAANNYIVFTFDNALDWQVAMDHFGIKPVKALDSKPGYMKQGIGRVLSGAELLKMLAGAEA